ncbi:hypothetical protein ACU36R_02445 [Pectobacterium brasiliense]|uniref:hypothetical protein n=1 Tax=Pectobacterium brasiliense TaxID=180957 RepID=UPI0004E6333A|nr:hypothetical protein [Pectobacterium brasiliense]KFF65990.1 hypothetical protein IV99_07090 [Pectobacterium brasiliense]
MTERIKTLDEVSSDIAATIQAKGNLYDETVITDGFYEHLFQNAIAHFAHLTRLAMERYYDETGRTLKFGVINTAAIGGFACVGKEDIDFIGIHFGTISLVSAIFTRMLSNPHILPGVGDTNLETNAGYTHFIPVQEDLTVFSPCRPACQVRSAFSKHLTLAGLDFIFGHEITHITNGHLGVLNQTRHPDPETRRPTLSPLENQAIELDADIGATQWTLMYTELVRNSRSKLSVEGFDPLSISWHEFYATELKTVGWCFMASYLTLRMLNPGSWDQANQEKIFQPLPPFRMGLLMQFYAHTLVEFHDMTFEKAQEYVYAFCIGSESVLANLLAESGQGEADFSAIDSFFNEVGHYSDQVNEAYDTLAKELSEFAMEETTKVTHPRPRTCGYIVLKGLKHGAEFIGILEAKHSEVSPKRLDLQCFFEERGLPTGLPFPLIFLPEFEGNMIEEALTANGKNYVALIEKVTDLETVELSSISDKTDLINFALQYSDCFNLKDDLIELLKA